MKVAIIGFERDGKDAFHYWQDLGADVTICKRTPSDDIPAGIPTQYGDDYLGGMENFDVIVRSSGIHPKLISQGNPEIERKITTTINEFLRVCPTKNSIGITGTKGKGTTATLTAKMLEAGGYKTFLAGNIGTPPLHLLPHMQADDWVVLELSSYQLFDVRYSPAIATCLMVEPEHLTWHSDYTDYKKAKSNLFAHQTPQDTAIYFAENEVSHSIASTSPGKKIPYYAAPGAYVADGAVMIDNMPLCSVSDIQLLGTHNLQNICAAVTIVWQISQSVAPIQNVLTSFNGLPHRLEYVREFEGVHFYNDSFASAPPATEAALAAIPGKKVLIMGGLDRHLPLDKLVVSIKAASNDIRTLVLIGASAGRLAEELQRADYTNFVLSTAATMGQVVAEAYNFAERGDTVVLSPGFPSHDMFPDFEVRGLQYKQAVNALAVS